MLARRQPGRGLWAIGTWTHEELLIELERFEAELREAGLRQNTVRTYVDRSHHYATDAVVITVSNPAPDATTGGAGLGIAGMRRRVTSLGGEFSAGTTSDGRFEVRAQIPTEGPT